MNFILTGFKQDNNFRQFVFDAVAADRTRTRFTIGADLVLIRKHHIALQDLPLLCRRFLEGLVDGDVSRTIIYPEGEMLAYASARAHERDEVARQKKVNRRPPSPAVGRAWRGPAPT